MDTPSEHLKGSSGLPLSLFETVKRNREGRSYSGARCALGKTRPEAADFLVFFQLLEYPIPLFACPSACHAKGVTFFELGSGGSY